MASVTLLILSGIRLKDGMAKTILSALADPLPAPCELALESPELPHPPTIELSIRIVSSKDTIPFFLLMFVFLPPVTVISVISYPFENHMTFKKTVCFFKNKCFEQLFMISPISIRRFARKLLEQRRKIGNIVKSSIRCDYADARRAFNQQPFGLFNSIFVQIFFYR